MKYLTCAPPEHKDVVVELEVVKLLSSGNHPGGITAIEIANELNEDIDTVATVLIRLLLNRKAWFETWGGRFSGHCSVHWHYGDNNPYGFPLTMDYEVASKNVKNANYWS